VFETLKPKKIAILGGGIASLTTAYELTNQPGWNSLYEITIYQTGWRLGGKCATGRNVKPHKPDHEPDYRIEEHGLHIFFGFYENAFRLLKECYDESGGNGPFSTIEDAFKPHNLIVLEEYINQNWINLPFDFPANTLVPWQGGGISSLWENIYTTLKFVLQIYTEIGYGQLQKPANFVEVISQQIALGKEVLEFLLDGSILQFPDQLIQLLLKEPSRWETWLKNINQDIKTALENLDFTSDAVFLNFACNLAQLLPQNTKAHRREHQQLILKLIDRFTERLNQQREPRDEQNAYTGWRLTLIDLALANIRGLFVDDVIQYRSLDVLDEYDYRDWLLKHGARKKSVDSAFIRVLYDLVYGFLDGNINKPRLAAGTAIRILMTILFQYNGAIMWKMQAGMGETVITPLYQVLKERGVKFKFFHVVKQLHLDEDQKSIVSIKIARQVNLKSPAQEYQPLINVKGLLCWPNQPLYDQIVDEEAKTLQEQNIDLESHWTPWQDVEEITLSAKNDDFDIVVLGIPIAGLPSICDQLIHAEKNPAHQQWQNMVTNVKTVTTQGGQIWLKPTLSQLGWKLSSPVLGAYVEPLDVYADMSELLQRENWPAEHYPYNVAYFTGVIADPGIPPSTEYSFPAQQQKKIESEAIAFLKTQIGHLWPNATLKENPQGLNWELLVDLKNRQGAERFDAQYWRVNIDPSERYVLSVPGSTKYRLKTDESGFNNLYLTGDWINNGYNSGCVEATVMSAMQTARAILQQCFRIKYTKEIIGEWDSWI
jgi:uncharacterized protein with NAD-binding domain and iron-sulfur cluster